MVRPERYDVSARMTISEKTEKIEVVKNRENVSSEIDKLKKGYKKFYSYENNWVYNTDENNGLFFDEKIKTILRKNTKEITGNPIKDFENFKVIKDETIEMLNNQLKKAQEYGNEKKVNRINSKICFIEKYYEDMLDMVSFIENRHSSIFNLSSNIYPSIRKFKTDDPLKDSKTVAAEIKKILNELNHQDEILKKKIRELEDNISDLEFRKVSTIKIDVLLDELANYYGISKDEINISSNLLSCKSMINDPKSKLKKEDLENMPKTKRLLTIVDYCIDNLDHLELKFYVNKTPSIQSESPNISLFNYDTNEFNKSQLKQDFYNRISEMSEEEIDYYIDDNHMLELGENYFRNFSIKTNISYISKNPILMKTVLNTLNIKAPKETQTKSEKSLIKKQIVS